ncbi:MBL fold metallo-hydrolase [Solihabitans fulvus]|uniref:MBL fold metallo-hydrolase n=1 Tax=Solihabitans fulvus TaxID=1892852 RepID=A0A5B2X5T7_9PSEU|nr:MBL fold metallo-hydrolase [Solihabitans fulvus]KAA2258717.1 MBL fold metallo-hydrolase [Solihabitans fulvus]
MLKPYLAAPDTYALPSALPIVGAGVLPVHAYVIRAEEPVLIDAGLPIDKGAFEAELWNLIDPADLRWIFVTHDDRDHIGSLTEILAAAPKATLVTNQLSVDRIAEYWNVPAHRVRTVNTGRSLDLGDRRITVVRPPAYDSPSTLAVYDHKLDTLFSADSFGTVLPEFAESAQDVSESDYFDGLALFTRANAPWTALVDQNKFDRVIDDIRKLNPGRILSSHGPIAAGRTDALLTAMRSIPSMTPWLPPEDVEVEAVLERHEAELAALRDVAAP